MGVAVVALAIAAPWLVWLSPMRGGAPTALLGALALAGAWHGYGRMVARLSRRDVSAPLAMYWGVAAATVMSGVAIAAHLYDPMLIVMVGCVAHTADLALRFRGLATTMTHRTRCVLAPAVLLVVLAIIAVLAAAGHRGTPYDDDGSVIGQIARLAQTGTLGDAVGYARVSQLGAHPALLGLASAFAAPGQAALVDGGLGFALVLALAYSRVRPRDSAAALWVVLLAVAACAFAIPGTETLAPMWIPAGLILALDATFADQRSGRTQLPLALLAGSLAAIRSEYAVISVAYIAASWWSDRKSFRRALVLGGTFVAVVAPFALTSALAWAKVTGGAHALVDARGGGAARFALFALIGALAAPLALVLVRELPGRGPRVLAVASALGVASVAALGERPFATHLYWPLVIAGATSVFVALAAHRELGVAALVLSVLSVVVIRDGQTATRRELSWPRRVTAMLDDVDYLRHEETAASPYDRLLARTPAGAAVAVWVTRPEALDYARNAIADLRTPRGARLRESSERLPRLARATGATWLLLDPDSPVSLDALALAPGAHVVAESAGTRLIQLRP